jgi:site-specific DNA-cytosine methylase
MAGRGGRDWRLETETMQHVEVTGAYRDQRLKNTASRGRAAPGFAAVIGGPPCQRFVA